MSGKRVLVIGGVGCGKTRLMEKLYRSCLTSDVPCLLLAGKHRYHDGPATDLVAKLAERSAFDRIRLEGGVLFIDDIDALRDDRRDPASALYYALLPVLEGRAAEYGKFRDQANLGKVSIVATATVGVRGERSVVLPGIAASAFSDTPLEIKPPDREEMVRPAAG